MEKRYRNKIIIIIIKVVGIRSISILGEGDYFGCFEYFSKSIFVIQRL